MQEVLNKSTINQNTPGITTTKRHFARQRKGQKNEHGNGTEVSITITRMV